MEQIYFTPEELQILSGEGSLKQFHTDQPIFFEGDAANDLYIIVKGRVRVTFHMRNGDKIVLQEVGPGQIFGESAFLRHSAHPTSVFAIDRVELISCSIDQLIRCLTRYPELVKKLLQLCSVTMNQLSYLIHDIHFLNRYGRVAAFLLRESGPQNLPLHLTHEEIGWHIGMDRATVSRVLRTFRQKQLIETGYRTLTILDRQGLASEAELGLRTGPAE